MLISLLDTTALNQDKRKSDTQPCLLSFSAVALRWVCFPESTSSTCLAWAVISANVVSFFVITLTTLRFVSPLIFFDENYIYQNYGQCKIKGFSMANVQGSISDHAFSKHPVHSEFISVKASISKTPVNFNKKVYYCMINLPWLHFPFDFGPRPDECMCEKDKYYCRTKLYLSFRSNTMCRKVLK